MILNIKYEVIEWEWFWQTRQITINVEGKLTVKFLKLKNNKNKG